MLQLKALANSNSIEFEEKLKIAAAHVNDRTKLYQLIQEQETTESITQEQNKEQAEIPLEASDTVPISFVEEKETVEEPIEEIEQESMAVNSEREQPTFEEADELTAQIMSEAISATFEQSADELIEDTEAEQEIEQQSDDSAETETSEKETIIQNEVSSKKELSFVEWLKLKKETYPTSRDKDVDAEVKTKPSGETSEKTKNEQSSGKMSKKEINALLDRFIAEQPSMQKPYEDFFKPSEFAKESVEESNDNVTETLAQIHVMQGNYQKAIAAYRQLGLLYPEKKAFFASRIKELEDKIS